MNKFLKLKDDEKINVSLADAEAAAAEGVSLSTYLNNKYSSIVEKFKGELDAFDIALLSKGWGRLLMNTQCCIIKRKGSLSRYISLCFHTAPME